MKKMFDFRSFSFRFLNFNYFLRFQKFFTEKALKFVDNCLDLELLYKFNQFLLSKIGTLLVSFHYRRNPEKIKKKL